MSRIDHGVRCLDDPALIARLREERVPLTVCPLSNVRLGVVDRIEKHRLPEMIDAGLMVTVNSDDPAYFGGYIDDNYQLIRTGLGIDDAQVRKLAENSFQAAFLDSGARARYLGELEEFSSPGS